MAGSRFSQQQALAQESSCSKVNVRSPTQEICRLVVFGRYWLSLTELLHVHFVLSGNRRLIVHLLNSVYFFMGLILLFLIHLLPCSDEK